MGSLGGGGIGECWCLLAAATPPKAAVDVTGGRWSRDFSPSQVTTGLSEAVG